MVYQMSILNLLDLYHRRMQEANLLQIHEFSSDTVFYILLRSCHQIQILQLMFLHEKTDLYMYMWQKSTRLDNFTIPFLQKKCFYCTCSVQSINTSLSSLGIRKVFSSGRYEPSHCSYLRFLNLQASRFVWMAMTI